MMIHPKQASPNYLFIQGRMSRMSGELIFKSCNFSDTGHYFFGNISCILKPFGRRIVSDI